MNAPAWAIRKADRRAQARFRVYLDKVLAGEDAAAEWGRYIEAEDVYCALKGTPRSERNEDAAHDAADWRLSAMTGTYAMLPDVPLARVRDEGDHFAGMPA